MSRKQTVNADKSMQNKQHCDIFSSKNAMTVKQVNVESVQQPFGLRQGRKTMFTPLIVCPKKLYA